jgi:outer membrane lipoprotein carrier protein
MMKKTCIVFFVLGIWSTVLGEYPSSEAIYRAIEKYSKNVQIHFKTRTYLSMLEEWTTSSGSLEVSEDKYRFNTKGLEWVSNGDTMWKYSEDNTQIVISSSAGKEPPSKVLLDFLKGRVISIKEVKQGVQVSLEPEGALDVYSKVEMLLEKETYIPKQIHTWDDEDNQAVYVVEKITPNVSFSNEHFEFPVEEYTRKNSEIEVVNLTDE